MSNLLHSLGLGKYAIHFQAEEVRDLFQLNARNYIQGDVPNMIYLFYTHPYHTLNMGQIDIKQL